MSTLTHTLAVQSIAMRLCVLHSLLLCSLLVSVCQYVPGCVCIYRCLCVYKNLWSSTHCLCANCEGHKDNESSNGSSNNNSSANVAIMALWLSLALFSPLLQWEGPRESNCNERTSRIRAPHELSKRTNESVRCSLYACMCVCLNERVLLLTFVFIQLETDPPRTLSLSISRAPTGWAMELGNVRQQQQQL